MKKVRIITHTGCDLPENIAEKYGIIFVSDHVIIDGKDYRNNIDITRDEFYGMLEDCESFPTSAHPSPAEFADAFRLCSDADEIICILLSSRATGSFQSARIAASLLDNDSFNPKIFLYESSSISFGTGLSVLRAAQMADSGCPASEILDTLDKTEKNIKVYFTLKTLEYASKSGRISEVIAKTAGAIGIIPVLQYTNSETRCIMKAFSLERAVKEIEKQLVKSICASAKTTVFIFHTDNFQKADKLRSDISAKYPDLNIETGAVSPVLSAYTGRGCVGIAFLSE